MVNSALYLLPSSEKGWFKCITLFLGSPPDITVILHNFTLFYTKCLTNVEICCKIVSSKEGGTK